MKSVPNTKLICKLLAVMAKYQNDGKGEVFYHLSGHISSITITVYAGKWSPHKEAEIYRDVNTDTGIQRAIEDINDLYNNTPDLAEVEARQKEKELQRRKEQYEALKKEFEE